MSRRIIAASGIFTVLATLGVVIYFQFSKVDNAYAAAANGDYRSKATGNWNSTSTWERYNGTSWVAATATPTNNDGAITILNGHTVTVTANVTADQVIIETGGQIDINSNKALTIANGSGTDIDISGTLKNTGTLTISSGAAIEVENGGTYQSNVNGESLPLATWNVGSSCLISGITNTIPSNLNQSFQNFTWNCAGQTAVLNFGANLQTIQGNFTLASTGTGTLFLDQQGNSSTINIGGDLNITGGNTYQCVNGSSTTNVSGNLIISGGSFSFNQSGATSYGNVSTTMNVTGNVIVTGGTLNLSQYSGNNNTKGVGALYLKGNLSITGGSVTETGNSSGEIYFNGTTQQTYSSTTLIANTIDFIVTSGAILSTNNTNITGAGDFTLMSGGSILITSTAGITSSGSTGNIQVTGSRSFSTGADYIYIGSGAQVSGNGLPSTVRNLTLNNGSGLTLTNNVAVSNTLTLTSGKITTDSYEVNVTNTAVTSVAGYSSSNYIVGDLRRSVSASANYDFPIGTSSNYELINVNLNSAAGFSNILGRFTNANPISASLPLSGLISNGINITNVLDYGYWTLTPNNSMTGGSYSVTLNSKGQSNYASNSSNYCVLSRSSTSALWQLTGTQSSSSVVNSVVTSSASALSSFGQFVHGYGGGSLPVELLYFKAKFVKDHVNLSWSTATEINNDYFTIERSSDGIHYEEVLRKPGAGNSSVRLEYSAIDDAPLNGISYYRLKQTDHDGKFERFPPKAVENSAAAMAEENSVTIKTIGPNPFTGSFNINYSVEGQAEVEVQISNTSGQTVFKETVTADKGFNTYTYQDMLGLPPGIYIVNMISNGQSVSKKLIKQ